MPPRLNKRQQRELEELEALGVADSSEDEGLASKISTAGFSSLLIPEEVGDDSEDEGSVKPAKSQKKKKKKKKSPAPEVAAAAPPPATPKSARNTPTTTPLVKNEKKALKKARAKEKKAGNEELEQALAELSIKHPEIQTSSAHNIHSLANLLSVSLAHLDSEGEMRKFFGSKVIQANKSGQSGASGSSRRVTSSQRSNLTRPQSTWWASNRREGLSIRVLTEEELSGRSLGPVEEKWWTVEYSKRYRSATKAFIQSAMAGDPEAFWDLLRELPWHADTLLQLSEVYRHREEYAQAFDFVDRAIFTYERAFIGAFNFTSGANRLDFERVENRPFFLAIHRQIMDLQRRGCVRTSFEFSRLLYSLNPWSDPHGALYHLDLLAIKGGMSQWLLDVYNHFAKLRERPSSAQPAHMDPSLLPGWAFARALILKIQEDFKNDTDHTASITALKEAVVSFPMVVPLLADKLDVSLPAPIRSHGDFRVETEKGSLPPEVACLHLLSHLYVQRSFSVWKEHSSWFTTTVTAAFSILPSVLPVTRQRQEFLTLFQRENIQYSAYRHIAILESTYRRLFAFIPRYVSDVKTLACDPLPPPTAASVYDDNFFQGTQGMEDLFVHRRRTRRQREAEGRRLQQAIPDAAFREQLQAFFQDNPQLAERFPGGVMQFIQLINQLPPDAIEDMLVGAVMRDGGEMPGQMPGFEGLMQEELPNEGVPPPVGLEPPDIEEEEDESDEDDEENISPMPRVLRNLIGRFWGRAPVVDDSSDDDDNPTPVDDTGVD